MGVWRDKKRKDWRYSFQYRGKMYAGGGFRLKGEAVSAREERRKRVKEEERLTLPGMGYRQAASLYLDFSERRHARKTYDYKKGVLRGFQGYLKSRRKVKDFQVDDISTIEVSGYLATRPSNNNYNVHRKHLGAFFSYVRRVLGVDMNNPCWNVTPMPVERKIKEIPTEQDILRVIMVSDPQKERPLLMVLIHTLARIDEILRLKWEDVNFEKRWVRLWTRKRKDGSWGSDLLYMNEDLYGVLMRLWKSKKQDIWVFFNEKTGFRFKRRQKFMARICKKAKIEPFGFHSLRHFVATYLDDREKIGRKTISTILRHQEERTTEIYLHKVNASVVEALKRLEGKFQNIA